jgi:hypothetical protein
VIRPRGEEARAFYTPVVLASGKRAPSRTMRAAHNNCNENNHHVVIGTQNYFVGGEGYLIPARKDQPPPELQRRR